MSGWMVWGGALALYLLSWLWYDGLRRPLTLTEIDAFFAEVNGKLGGGIDTSALLQLTAMRPM